MNKVSITRTEQGLLKLSMMMTDSYGQDFLYTKSYEGYSPEEARILFMQDSFLDNPYAVIA